MYRAVTWLALRESVSMDDEEALTALAVNNPVQVDRANPGLVVVRGVSLGSELRSSEVNNRVSLVARVSDVRSALVHQQRLLADEGEIVMVGRDIGTVVLPDADMKIFIEASLEERAKRRWREMLSNGQDIDYQRVLRETRERDELDTGRADSPLRQAEDAWVIDTGSLTEDDVVELILQRVERLNNPLTVSPAQPAPSPAQLAPGEFPAPQRLSREGGNLEAGGGGPWG